MRCSETYVNQKRIYLLITFCFAVTITRSQINLITAKSIGGSGTEHANSISVDLNNNIYVAGDFMNTVDFDPGSGSANRTAVGLSDLFFAKYNSTGNFVWVNSIGSSGRETVNCIKTDNPGNVYITGYFEGDVDFNTGTGIDTLRATGTGRSLYFAKYDASGNYVWARTLEGGFTHIGNSLAVDAVGNVYITGYITGTADFDPGTGTVNLNSGIVFAKYDNNGNYIRAWTLSSNGPHQGMSLQLDPSGNVYIAGYFGGVMDFDPGAGTTSLNGGNQSGFFAKYDSSGNFIWANQIGIAAYNNISEISIDGLSNLYVTGVFSGTTDFDPGPGTSIIYSTGFGDLFYAKYNSAGALIWAKTLGTTGWEEGYAISTYNNEIYVTGYFTNNIDFDPGIGVVTLSSTGSPEIFLSKFNSSGDLIWAKSFGSTSYDEGKSIVVNNNGDILMCGVFSETVDFEPGQGTFNLNAFPGSNDAYFVKYSSTTTDLKQIRENELVHIYPNPADKLLTIRLESILYNERLVLRIINNLGQIIREEDLVYINKQTLITTNDLPDGIYSLLLNNGNAGVMSKRFVVSH